MSLGSFVVISAGGLFWDGAAWTPHRGIAGPLQGWRRRLRRLHLAVSCLRRLGVRCGVAYLPVRAAAEVVIAQQPRSDAVKVRGKYLDGPGRSGTHVDL